MKSLTLTFLLVGCAALGQTHVDILTSFNAGTVGNLISAASLSNSTTGTGGTWTVSGGDTSIYFTTTNATDARGTVEVGSDTRIDYAPDVALAMPASTNAQTATFTFSAAKDSVSIGVALFLGGPSSYSYSTYDLIAIYGAGEFLTANLDEKPGASYVIRLHSQAGLAANVPVSTNTPYWITIKWDKPTLKGNMAVYSVPGYTLIQSNSIVLQNKSAASVHLGRYDVHEYFSSAVFAWDDLVIDWTSATYPLLIPDDTNSIPSERTVDWDPGVRGGIVSGQTNIIDVTDAPYSAANDGLTDVTAILQSAITASPSNGVVYLPSGTYLVDGGLRIKSGVVVRGAGETNTTIKGKSGATQDWIIGFEPAGYNWDLTDYADVDIDGSLAKGATNIVTTSAHGLVAGDIVLIDQLETPNGDPPVSNVGTLGETTWCGRDSGNRPIGQVVRVESVTETNAFTFSPPSFWNYDATNTPQVVKFGTTTKMAGIESLQIDNSVSQVRDTVVMHFANNCWLSSVDMVGAYRRMIDMIGCLWNTVRGCQFRDGTPLEPIPGSQYGSDRAYGIGVEQWVSATLIEDNEFSHLGLPIALDCLSSGNVISYNFATNLHYTDASWSRFAALQHGPHPMMNLYEGNLFAGNSGGDNYHGSSSHSTYLRNRLLSESGKEWGTWTVDLNQDTTYYSYVGNILGPTNADRYQLEGENFTNYQGPITVFRLGYSDAGDLLAAGNDTNVLATLLRHGNWDYAQDVVSWDEAISNHTVPRSEYLSSTPVWWGGGRWPAFGPDLSPMSSTIPALSRFLQRDGPSFGRTATAGTVNVGTLIIGP